MLVNFDDTAAQVTLALAGAGMPAVRKDYVLTPGEPALGLASATMALNGKVLAVDAGNALPTFTPVQRGAQEVLVLPPQSYAFVTLPEAMAPAC